METAQVAKNPPGKIENSFVMIEKYTPLKWQLVVIEEIAVRIVLH